MSADRNNPVLHRQLVSAKIGDVTLLDAIEDIDENGSPQVYLFFDSQTDVGQITLPTAWRVVNSGSVNGAPWLLAKTKGRGPFELEIAGQSALITPAHHNLDFLEGANTALSVRNGESASTVFTWLKYHCTQHGMDGAVILDRAKLGTDNRFARKLERSLASADFDCRIIILSSDVPLGHRHLPPEAHPFCVPGAPGKDRMKIPDADPWNAPFGAFLFYEIARIRFLNKSRAVANIDVFDLLDHKSDINVFDSAVAAKEGVIKLLGSRCYPWRTRKGSDTQFADHICVQFDNETYQKRWCIAPPKAPKSAVWRLVRIGNAEPDPSTTGYFYRCMALRHPAKSVAKIVPKSSLIEHQPLLTLSKDLFDHNPVRLPRISKNKPAARRGRRAIVTTMKNEGPFILEWIAYHLAIGFDDILVYTNDCTDGTDTMLDLLASRGLIQHRDNPFRDSGLKPQHAALRDAENEPIIKDAEWVTCIDVDEYINIKTGTGTLDDLFAAVPDANMISMTWRLFGNNNIHDFKDDFITEQFTRCAPEFAPKPHQAWGFKTLFQNIGLFRKLGVHRPKGLNGPLWEQINWVNGSGKPLPKDFYRNAWRVNAKTYGYDLVALNHYAVRSAESFLVKRDRGRVNHVDRDQGLSYWFRMNNNAEIEGSIKHVLPLMKAKYETLMSDPEISAMHDNCVKMHREKIAALRATSKYTEFFNDLTSERFEKLAHLHAHFGANVFLSGPDVVPKEVVDRDPNEQFFFTVEKSETTH